MRARAGPQTPAPTMRTFRGGLKLDISEMVKLEYKVASVKQ
jgi:hypothetical protein